jgi:hypothetical protein
VQCWHPGSSKRSTPWLGRVNKSVLTCSATEIGK